MVVAPSDGSFPIPAPLGESFRCKGAMWGNRWRPIILYHPIDRGRGLGLWSNGTKLRYYCHALKSGFRPG